MGHRPGGAFGERGAALQRHSDFQAAVDRIAAGAPAETVLDDRFVDAFAIAGTADECIERIASYRRAGVTELAFTFVGADPVADIAYLAAAVR